MRVNTKNWNNFQNYNTQNWVLAGQQQYIAQVTGSILFAFSSLKQRPSLNRVDCASLNNIIIERKLYFVFTQVAFALC